MNFIHPNRFTVIASAAALSLGVGAIATTGIALAHRDVTLEVNGVEQPVSGFLTTVDDVLNQAGIEPGEHDEVAPHRYATITDGSTIVVRTAYPYTVTENGQQKTIWSTATSYSQVLENLGGGIVLAADRSQSRQELPLIAASQKVSVVVDGKTLTVDAHSGDDINTLLANAGVSVSPIDRVRLDHENGILTILVQRVTRGNVTSNEVIAKPIEERDDDSLYEGETSVLSEGSDGQVVTTTYVETIDGKPTVQAMINQNRIEPTPHIVAKGTMKRDAAPTRSHAAPSGPVNIEGAWAALAQCESGGNPATNTGNGYYGMYQFSLPTWQSVGGSGLPSEASAAEQTMRAQILQQRSGWGQWPACSASLGLY